MALRKTADEVYLYLFKAAVVTGARISELCGLDWDDVDLLAGTVRISKQYVPTHGVISPKDGEERTVYLTAEGKDIFIEWAKAAGTDWPVFVGRHGERINSDYTWRVLEHARKTAGIPKLGESGKPRSVHSLRDTYARRMLEAGTAPAVGAGEPRALRPRADDERVRAVGQGRAHRARPRSRGAHCDRYLPLLLIVLALALRVLYVRWLQPVVVGAVDGLGR